MDADVGETEEHSENETDPTDSNEGQTQLTDPSQRTKVGGGSGSCREEGQS